jgi:hypothetical protein
VSEPEDTVVWGLRWRANASYKNRSISVCRDGNAAMNIRTCLMCGPGKRPVHLSHFPGRAISQGGGGMGHREGVRMTLRRGAPWRGEGSCGGQQPAVDAAAVLKVPVQGFDSPCPGAVLSATGTMHYNNNNDITRIEGNDMT